MILTEIWEPTRGRWLRRPKYEQRRPRPAPGSVECAPRRAAAPEGACKLLGQRTAVHAGTDPHHRRRCLYELFKKTDRRLLGNFSRRSSRWSASPPGGRRRATRTG